ncbi:MAG: bifunctional [glutamate--ammonia ligase]-adenylyl-L-tyrosine phosphorylase/[glutamate--ammonia-ligase] adenylyltransferase [Gammaproteobacteria bacterium]|nr:bifunctional [glutamate--ammonia ligase]-adenylyl-L-tyrosine phosphorylase/[glutamate--ammonia-ligase] adenylyltransferase [Gammaproteobacteria bacterium]
MNVRLIKVPDLLVVEEQQLWARLGDVVCQYDDQHWQLCLLQEGDIRQVMLASPWCVQNWLVAPQQLNPQWFKQAYDKATMHKELASALVGVQTEAQLAKALREFRCRHQQRLIWRNTLRLCTSAQLTQEVTNMADICIDLALQWLYADAVDSWGQPLDTQGRTQQLVVLAMGKQGGGELNLSSDIDLIFAFSEAGETQGGRQQLDNQQFFTRLGQRLIQALDQRTADGFVFRVDMRLRPYGASGALVLNFTAMERYYQEQGREWERYAFIKARVVAGDRQAGAELLQTLRPFVYRRYLDYSAIESLRGLKHMIAGEVRRRGLHNNIKLGSGGIREVEFIAQALQLIRGGRDQRLQTPCLMSVLDLLPEVAGWQVKDMLDLKAAYWCLRDVEHALQAIQDQQTQELPQDKTAQARLAFAMGYATWEALNQQIEQQRTFIRRQFDMVVCSHTEAETNSQQVPAINSLCNQLGLINSAYQLAIPQQEWQQMLVQAGFSESDKVLQHLLALYQSRAARTMQAVAQERLTKLLPGLLHLCSQQVQPAQTLARVLVLIEAVLRRSVYLVLLQENPSTLRLVVDLCAASPWFADFLAHQPSLLDELLDANTLFAVPTPALLAQELQQRLLRVPEDDMEQTMEVLRHFKQASALRVAAQEVTGKLPLMRVSDQLTFTAEVVLQQVLRLAWRELGQRYGEPCDGQQSAADFIIVGYGKVGGWELSYGSDLDLVFIYDAPFNGMTNGDKSIANSVFFTRLGQRIISYLNTITAAGQLYEVDMRLRPDGAKGLLVSTLSAFAKYQQQQAWTWEHQALVRARPIAGSATLATRFDQVRQQVLAQIREPEKLRQEVVAMREKMRASLASKPNLQGEMEYFHLKQDQGGIVDIEFMVQFGVLAYAHKEPALLTYTDNIRILDALRDAGLMSANVTQILADCYRAMRAVEHRQALQNQAGQVAIDELQEQRQQVQAIWQDLMLP